MATADELLATRVVEEECFLIDLATRTISIPKSVPVLGVESDEDVMRVKFKLPRFYYHSDFSKFIIGVNYVNAQGVKDRYEPDDIVVGSDYITFSWVVSRLAAITAGNVTFSLCLKKMSMTEPGVTDDEFNTTPATLPIIKGLEVSQAIVQEYSDVLEQWRQQLFGFGDTLEQRIVAATEAQIAAIEAKGAETRDTIPDDYNKLYDMANDAVRTRANAVIETAEGEVVTASDCSDDPLRGLRVFGKSTQATTTGAQMFDKSTAAVGMLETDGSITPDSAYVTSDFIPVTPNTAYHQTEKETIRSKYYDANKEVISDVWDMQQPTTGSFTTPDNAYYFRVTVRTNYIDSYMLNAGNTALPYEPYSGGVASPCPAWPQEIENINDPTIGVFGSNLADASSIEVGSNLKLTVSEDGYTVEVTGGADKPYTSSPVQLPMEMLRGKTVILSADSISNSQASGGKGGNVQLNIRDSVKMKYVAISPNNLTATTIIPEDVSRVDLNVYTNNSATLFDTPNTTTVKGLRLSVVDAAWEEYRDAQTLPMPYSLCGIPVSSDGDYVDQNGQHWLCDEIDFGRGVYIQRVGQLVVDNSMTYYYNTDNFFLHTGSDIFDNVAPWETRIMSTHFIPVGNGIGLTDNGWFQFNGNGGIRFKIEGVDSVEALTAWLNVNTPKVIYPLATPIETPLTDAEIYAFSKIHSNYPNMTIVNDSDAHMAVDYNADTKIYCAKTHGPTDDQVQSAVDEYLVTHLISAEGVSF